MGKAKNEVRIKTLHLNSKEYKKLGEFGTANDTYASIVVRLMNFYEKYRKFEHVEDILCGSCKLKVQSLA